MNKSSLSRVNHRSASAALAASVIECLEARTLLAGVTVDTQEVYQTIRGIGGNFAQGRKTGSEFINDAVGQYVLDHLPVAHARVGIPLKAWEPVNDNDDDASANFDPSSGTAFVNSGSVRNVLLLMQDLSSRGIPITLSVWDAPDWMVSNPTWTNQRVVPAEMFPELVESITTFLTTARDDYGVQTIDAVSFNESDGGYFLLQSAQEQASIIKLAGPRFEAAGMGEVKWLVGDTATPGGLYDYAAAILADAEAQPYLGAISFHSWGALSTSDSTFTRIASLAEQYGKEVWVEEVGYDSQLYKLPDTFKTWTYATKLAQTYFKVLKLSGASVADYWEYQDDYPLVDADTLKPSPAFFIVRELSQGLAPGTQIVAANSDDTAVQALAGKNVADDSFMLQLINTTSEPQDVSINGLPSSALALVRSSAAANFAKVGSFTPVNGVLTLTLPADSISTLKGRLAVPAPWADRDIGLAGIAGSATFDGGTFSLRASGGGFDAGSTEDALHFVSQASGSSASLVARLVDLPATGEAGLMIRDSAAADAAYVALVVDAKGEASLRLRTAAGSASADAGSRAGLAAGSWLRLVREGTTFVASVSADGVEWTDVAAISDVALSDSAMAGLAATSRDNAVLASFAMDRVSLVSLPVALSPIRLSAKVGAYTPTGARVDLAWMDVSARESGFEIERSEEGTVYQLIGTAGVNASGFSDTTAQQGARYFYRVRAVNASGAGPYSPLAMVRTGVLYEAELAASYAVSIDSNWTGFTGTGFANFKNLSGSWVEWTVAAPEDGQYGLEWRYAITTDRALQISVDGNVIESSFTFPKTATLTTWTTLTLPVTLSAGQHTVRLTTIGFDGPNVDSLRLGALVPATPANVSATVEGGHTKLSWLESAVTQDEVYRIERSTDGISFDEIGTTAPNASEFVDATSEALVPYVYQVRASSPAGDSKYSPLLAFTIPVPPAAPPNATAAAASSTRVDLAWDDQGDNEEGYQVEHSVNGIDFALLATLPADSTAYAAENLEPGTAHYFRVRAINAAGVSDFAAASAITPLATPQNLVAEGTSQSEIRLTWQAVTNASEYVVQRSDTPEPDAAWQTLATLGAVTSFLDTGLDAETTYYYRLQALNDLTQSPFSDVAGGTTLGVLAAPLVDAGADRSADEGDALSFAGSFTDADSPIAPGSHLVSWDFGDGATADGTLSPVHAYADDGQYTVRLTVTDTDGLSGSDTMTVTVGNVAPAVDAGADRAATVGQAVTLAGSFVDPGAGDTHAIAWDFGDGSAPVTGTLNPSHIFTSAGTYSVTLTVTDDDGGSDSDTALVTVSAPVLKTVTLTNTVATYVRDGRYARKNYGSAGAIYVQKSASSGSNRESWLKFDLSGVASIEQATLRLYGSASSSGSITMQVFSSSNTSWNEKTLTWNNRPASGSTVLGSSGVTGTSDRWYEIDLSDFLRAEQAAGHNAVTLVLNSATTSSTYGEFTSDDSATNRPQLVLQVSEQPPAATRVIVTPSTLAVPEGQSRSFAVTLDAAPAGDVTVSISRQSGDTDLSADRSTLVFSAANWNTPQVVNITAAQDGDAVNGSATFSVTAPGLASQSVSVTEVDDDQSTLEPITVAVSADAYVRGGTYADTPLGTAPELAAKLAGTSTNIREIYLKFDLSDVSAIATAKLRLYGRLSDSQNASVKLNVFSAPDTTWSEATLTYNTRPATDATILGSVTVSGTSATWYEVDLSSFLRAELDAGRRQVTLALKGVTSTSSYALFNSQEAGANAPELAILQSAV